MISQLKEILASRASDAQKVAAIQAIADNYMDTKEVIDRLRRACHNRSPDQDLPVAQMIDLKYDPNGHFPHRPTPTPLAIKIYNLKAGSKPSTILSVGQHVGLLDGYETLYRIGDNINQGQQVTLEDGRVGTVHAKPNPFEVWVLVDGKYELAQRQSLSL